MTKLIIKKLILAVGLLLVLNLIGLVYFSQEDLKRPIKTDKNLLESASSRRQSASSQPKSATAKVIFLDVGQGDAILIQTPQKKNILIDGGPDRQIIYKLDQYISIINRKIDFLILTHPDPDHLNGLVEVLKRYEVDQVIFTNVDDPDPAYFEFKKIIQEKNISQKVIEGIEKIILEGEIYLDIFHPLESLTGKSFKNDNSTSIVAKLVYDQTSFLFTGDVTKEVEEKLLKRNINLKSDLLKISHHGSKDATSEEFLEKIKPTYAVISVGKNNKYGHPHLRVLKNLEKAGAEVYRTDEDGDIIFKSNGGNLEIKTKSRGAGS